MEEMTRKQPDVDKVTKTYKRKPAEAPSSLAERRGARESPFSGFYRTNIVLHFRKGVHVGLPLCVCYSFVMKLYLCLPSAGKPQQQQQQQAAMQVSGGNPRLNQLCGRWQQVWLLALDRQRKLNDALDRLEEV